MERLDRHAGLRLAVRDVDEWTATRDTLHMWAQIVGKIAMVQNAADKSLVASDVVCRSPGLTAGTVPYRDAPCSGARRPTPSPIFTRTVTRLQSG